MYSRYIHYFVAYGNSCILLENSFGIFDAEAACWCISIYFPCALWIENRWKSWPFWVRFFLSGKAQNGSTLEIRNDDIIKVH